MAVDQLRDFLEQGNVTNSVNFPDCRLPFSGAKRIIVANRNIPNMVGQITNVLAEARINIRDMLNKSRGDLAYNIIDVDGDVTDTEIRKIKTIEGVIMARFIERN